MIPTKYASSDMNSAASPRNETTRLSALATGLRLMTTAAPKINVISAKTQNKNDDIIDCRLGIETRSLPSLARRYPSRLCLLSRRSLASAADCGKKTSLFFLVPFQDNTVHYSADFEQLLLVMHHFRARESGDGIVFAQKDRLLGTNLFAHPAENAADHIYLVCRLLLEKKKEGINGKNFTRNNIHYA